ncbi:uncharacterized protein LOC110118995 [Ceratitis capitata]|uniref:uncharacterized protein LOC110118995 n=1 Tax=Ceratitis capitata TaxID=7213 RepID=UPI000A101B91|nr:uncharacterized protein LOC110118995 [Ceratitis capitata]
MQSVCWPAICWAKEKEHIQKPLYECSMQLDNCNYCTFSARRRLQNSIGILKERQSMDGNAKQLSGSHRHDLEALTSRISCQPCTHFPAMCCLLIRLLPLTQSYWSRA